ncbi:MAG: hypothetical protein J7641_10710 [Cyanobacteria bacterium SID2]|nr:hypothetical protein [Cyanobacteria bacterium SID2]MBP0002462.1 hypothetical protein [Cyanobacteria bacterium SBC]
MSEVQRLLLDLEGETYEIYIESKETPQMPTEPVSLDYRQDDDETYALRPGEARVKMQQVRKMIRGYAMYALSAFKDFSLATVEDVTLKFGIKMGAKTGIPYITEGTIDSNLEIQVKCKFPNE